MYKIERLLTVRRTPEQRLQRIEEQIRGVSGRLDRHIGESKRAKLEFLLGRLTDLQTELLRYQESKHALPETVDDFHLPIFQD